MAVPGREMRRRKLRTLSGLLLGEKYADRSRGKYGLESGKRSTGKDGVRITPVKMQSRPYPHYLTDSKGKVHGGYRTETIPGLLLEPPEGRSKDKAVIALHQHALQFDIGKSEVAGLKGDVEQAYGLELAKRGYVVICFDFSPFEERMNKKENPFGIDRGYYGERMVKQGNIHGIEPMGIHVLDTMRAADVLESRGCASIGVIGHSLGAMVGLNAMALDPRIRAGAFNCGIASYQSIEEIYMIHNWAWSIKDVLGRLGEAHEILGLIEPRPALITAGIKDSFFPIEGARKTIRWAREKFSGCRGLEYREFDAGHSFPPEARQHAYDFLDRNL